MYICTQLAYIQVSKRLKDPPAGHFAGGESGGRQAAYRNADLSGSGLEPRSPKEKDDRLATDERDPVGVHSRNHNPSCGLASIQPNLTFYWVSWPGSLSVHGVMQGSGGSSKSLEPMFFKGRV